MHQSRQLETRSLIEPNAVHPMHDAIMIMHPKKYDKPGVARITIIIFHLALTHRIITSPRVVYRSFLRAFVFLCRERDFVLRINEMLVSFSVA